jgi:hypothetical protein
LGRRSRRKAAFGLVERPALARSSTGTTSPPFRHALLPIGGSWAQRDVFNQLLLEAAIQAGNWPLARSMASERIALRPENHLNWLKFGQMFDAAGDPEAAERVREIAAQYRP